LSIPVIAMVDTCCDPTPIDFVIPANDDAAKSISLILNLLCTAVNEGTNERKFEKEKETPDMAPSAYEREDSSSSKRRTRKGAPRPMTTHEEPVALKEEPVAPVEEPVTPQEEPAAPVEEPEVEAQ